MKDERPRAKRSRLLLALLVVAACSAAAIVAWRFFSVVPDPEPVPPPYAGLRRPSEPFDREAARSLFVENCAPCHDERGTGHGPGSEGLTPLPAPLSSSGFLAARSDAYLFWRISEGKPGTAMPSFRETLSVAQRWALIVWLRDAWQR